MIVSIFQNEIFSAFDFISVYNADDNIEISYKGDFLTKRFLYFTYINGEFIIGDDFIELCKHAQSFTPLLFEKMIEDIFIDKGYAPFHYTIVEDIFKLPNISVLVVNKKSMKWRLKIQELPKSEKSSKTIIEESIIKCLDKKKTNIVLFSGGYDSTLVALIAKRNLPSGNLKLVTGQISGIDFIPNQEDTLYSKKLADKMGLKYDVTNVNIDSVSVKEMDEFIFCQPNAAHFSLNFNKISKSYPGDKYNVLSGQQADSILNFGSTSFIKFKGICPEGSGELLRRFIYLSSIKLVRQIFNLLNKGFDKKYTQLSLIYGKRKFPIVSDKNKWIKLGIAYDSYLSKFNKTDSEILLNSFHRFYVNTFISGSDSSSVLSIFKDTNSPLPFNYIPLISHFISKKNSFYDKWIPKRSIMDILKTDKILWNIINTRPNTPNVSYLTMFYAIGKRLNLEEYCEKAGKRYNINFPYCYNSYHVYRVFDKINEI